MPLLGRKINRKRQLCFVWLKLSIFSFLTPELAGLDINYSGLLTLAGGLCEDHLIIICHILIIF